MSDKDFKMVTNHESTFHLPDPVAVECLVVEDKINNLAKTTHDKPRTIIKQCQSTLSKEASAKMKCYSSLVQIMNRKRSNKATYGDNPKSIADIIVPIELTVTLVNKEPFVWKDSGYGDPDRIIVLTT